MVQQAWERWLGLGGPVGVLGRGEPTERAVSVLVSAVLKAQASTMTWAARTGPELSTVLSVLERFSDDAHRIVTLGEGEARRLGHPHIGTEHLLLGIVADGGSAAARALVASGVTLDACRDKVAEAVAIPGKVSDAGDLPFTDRAKRALERASRLTPPPG